MVLARWQRPIQDGAGNLVLSGMIEVRREDTLGSPLARIYSDREGTVPQQNPFSFSDGMPSFHALGGSYKVRAYGNGFDETYRYQAVGTGGEVDADSLLIPGFLFEFEPETTESPSEGCIRASAEDLSEADHLYISKTTIAGADVATALTAYNEQRILLTSTDRGQQAEFFVDSITDDGDYYQLAVSGHVGITSIPTGRVGLQRQGAPGEPGEDGAITGEEEVYTSASNSIGAAEGGKTLIANSGSAIAFNLDDAATLGDKWMALIKNIGAGELTVDADGSDLIDDAGTATFATGESGVLVCNGSGFRLLMANGLRSNATGQLITGGARTPPLDLGNLSGESITPDPGNRPIQKVTNNGAGSILPGSNEGQYTLLVVNASGAGAITTTGWTLKGDSFDTSSTSRFVCSCLVTSDVKLMTVLKVA